jgi:hypothetical protein
VAFARDFGRRSAQPADKKIVGWLLSLLSLENIHRENDSFGRQGPVSAAGQERSINHNT